MAHVLPVPKRRYAKKEGGEIMDRKDNNMEAEIMAVLSDTYKFIYSVRFKVFERVLRHMLSKIGTEPTIYLLMELVRKNRKKK